MESKSPKVEGVSRVVTDNMVKFCFQCNVETKFDMCDEHFLVKRETATASYQLDMDITCLYSKSSTDMIGDTGSPMFLVGVKDEAVVKKNLSQFQQENFRTQNDDISFNFGSSGPYKCGKRLSFPIFNGVKDIFAEVSVVDGDVPSR